MGGKKSSPAPAVTTQPTVITPAVDVAQVAAEKALAAQGNVRASQAAENDPERQRRQRMGDVRPKMPRERDAAAVTNQTTGGNMGSSTILTG